MGWVASRCSLYRSYIQDIVEERLPDEAIGEDACSQLAAAVSLGGEPEQLRFADLVGENCEILRENLRYLLGTLEHGGKKALAESVDVDPTTVSRWLSGASQPPASTLERLRCYFGLPSGTNLLTHPIFLSSTPIATSERKDWVIACVREMPAEEFRALYPALHRMLERQ